MQHRGLGIHYLKKFSRSLKLRWLWLEWQQLHRPWDGSPAPCDDAERELFSRATKVSVGNGRTANFWNCKWIDDQALRYVFLALFKHSRWKGRCVAEALENNTWINDLRHGDRIAIKHDFLNLWRMIQTADTTLTQDADDMIRWTAARSGSYSARFAYTMQFPPASNGGPEIDHMEARGTGEDEALLLASASQPDVVQRPAAASRLGKRVLLPALL